MNSAKISIEENCPFCLLVGNGTSILEKTYSVDMQVVCYCPLCQQIYTQEEIDQAYEEIYG